MSIQSASVDSMMKLTLKGLGAGAIALGLFSCAATTSSGTGDAGAAGDSEKLQVVTTFLPMTQFTQAVAGSCAEVSQILPNNIGPHDYQAKPTDAQRISQADVLVQNGLELEGFLEPMIANAGNPDLQIVEASEGLELLAMAEGGHDDHGEEAGHDDHGHADEKVAKADHDDHDHHDDHDDHGDEKVAEAGHDHDDHGHEDHDDHDDEKIAGAGHNDHHGHDHGEFDPHVWLDPQRAAEQVNVIRDGLIAAAPDCQAEFTANAAAYTEKLTALDQEIEQDLAPFSGKTFVTYHDFANYFATRYGLGVDFLVGVPEENPSPNDVKRVLETAQNSGLKTLLTESEASAATFQAVAKDLGVGVSAFQPNEVGGPESLEPDYYFTVMRENTANLVAAFTGQN